VNNEKSEMKNVKHLDNFNNNGRKYHAEGYSGKKI
jgi:hypothetical protein